MTFTRMAAAAAYLTREAGAGVRLACAAVAFAWTGALLVALLIGLLLVSCDAGECFR